MMYVASYLDKMMIFCTHSSTLAWKIPWLEEPGRLQSMGSQRVGHDWVTELIIMSTVNQHQVISIYGFVSILFIVRGTGDQWTPTSVPSFNCT